MRKKVWQAMADQSGFVTVPAGQFFSKFLTENNF